MLGPCPEKYRPNTGKQADLIALNSEDRSKAVCFTKMLGVQSITKLGYVASMVVDKTNRCYVAIRPLLNHQMPQHLECVCREISISNTRYAVCSGEEDNLEEYCEWVPGEMCWESTHFCTWRKRNSKTSENKRYQFS